MALKLADVAPPATVTDEGTVSAAFVLVRVITDPLLGAGPDNMTVQVDVEPEARVAGEHCKLETVGSALGATLITPPVPEIPSKVPSVRVPRTLLMGRDS